MLEGKVLATGEAVVTIAVRGPAGTVARVEALVDMGFNEYLTLPTWVVEKLQLLFEDEAYYTLADGVQSSTRIFRGELEWHGVWREVLIVEIENDALLGMGAMKGSNLNMDITDGGRILITPL